MVAMLLNIQRWVWDNEASIDAIYEEMSVAFGGSVGVGR